MITAVDTSVLLDIFLPDDQHGEESKRRLRMIRDGELLESPVAGVPDVYFAGQGGLFDDAVTPRRAMPVKVGLIVLRSRPRD